MGYLVHHQVQRLSNRKEAQCEDYQKKTIRKLSCRSVKDRLIDPVSSYYSLRNPLRLSAPELITHSPEESDTVTLRKRRLPLEMMAW